LQPNMLAALDSTIRIVIAGHFQHGKSTLTKLLIPDSNVVFGDGTEPTTDDAQEYLSACKTINIIDTPGVNGKPEHDRKAIHALTGADIAIFVVMTDRALLECVKEHFRQAAVLRTPTIVILNCKDPAGDERNDPVFAEKCEIAKTIVHQISNLGVGVFRTFTTNLAWAAAGKGFLDREHRVTKRIFGEYRELFPADNNADEMYKKSNFESIERYILAPNPDLFSVGGLLVNAIKGRISQKMRNSLNHGT